MQKYSDIDRDSGVREFEIHDTSITIIFSGSRKAYIYSYQSAGQHHIDKMKLLALAGEGLNAYINKNVKNKFSR
jgi:hypothetical protein